MNIKQQFEACAELEFGSRFNEIDGKTIWVIESDGCGEQHQPVFRDYDTDNEIDRLVRGLDTGELMSYGALLFLINDAGMFVDTLQATTAQKREALLRATGKWEGE